MKQLHSEGIKDSLQIRLIENLHIFLWLIKDLCWSMDWKVGGVVMVLPTVSMAVYICWRSRKSLSELIHSIAVTCWISANSIWMIGEFTNYETRHYAGILFAIGIILIVYYYLAHFRKDQAANREAIAAINDSPTSSLQ